MSVSIIKQQKVKVAPLTYAAADWYHHHAQIKEVPENTTATGEVLLLNLDFDVTCCHRP